MSHSDRPKKGSLSAFRPKETASDAAGSFGFSVSFRPKLSLSVNCGFRPKLHSSESALSVLAATLTVDHYGVVPF